jgi:hypothetical protein
MPVAAAGFLGGVGGVIMAVVVIMVVIMVVTMVVTMAMVVVVLVTMVMNVIVLVTVHMIVAVTMTMSMFVIVIVAVSMVMIVIMVVRMTMGVVMVVRMTMIVVMAVRMIMGVVMAVRMIVVMPMTMTMTVAVLMPVSVGVGIGLRVEGRLQCHDVQAQIQQLFTLARGIFQQQVVGADFDRRVVVAEVIGGTQQHRGICTGRPQYFLRRGDHADQSPVVGHQRAAVAQYGALGQRQADFVAIVQGCGQLVAAAQLEGQDQCGRALEQRLGQAGAGHFFDTSHG